MIIPLQFKRKISITNGFYNLKNAIFMSQAKSTTEFKSNKGDLTTGSIKNHLIRLSGPMTWGIMMIISFQLVDTYFVSLLGTDDLAAFSFTFPVTYFIFSFIMGFSIAMSSVVSRLVGAGDGNTVRRVATHGLVMVMAISIILSLLGLFFLEPLFTLLGAPAEMLPSIKDYMTIWFWGAIFVSTPMVGNAAMRACGDAFTPAIIMTLAAIVNIILDPILMFGLLGFPRLELEGAAIATVIANAGAMAVGLWLLYKPKNILCPKALINYSNFKDSTKRLAFIALPAGITNSIQPIVNAIIIALLAKSGTEAVAAFGVVTRIEAFAFIILMGLAVGMAPIIGQNWGAEKFDRVKETLKISINFNILWSFFIAIILGLFATPIMKLFSNNSDVIRYGVLFFWIVPFTYAFSNLLNGWASAYNAMGKPQRSVIMIFVKLVILLIPALYIGHALNGTIGVFIAIAAVNFSAGLFFHFWSWKTCLKGKNCSP
jgi:putative MATE family efflux protein